MRRHTSFGGKRRRDQEQDPLPSGESLLRMADVIACHADQLKAKDKSDNGGIWSNATVKCMRDWAMMSALFGHIPTMRLSTLLTLAHPDFCEDGACTHADCKDELCVGNRMSWVLRWVNNFFYRSGLLWFTDLIYSDLQCFSWLKSSDQICFMICTVVLGIWSDLLVFL